MTTPATILRDAAIAGLALSLLGALLGGGEWGGGVAAGALGSLVNLFLLWRAVSGAGVQSDGYVLGRIAFKTGTGVLILVVLVANLPAAPVLLGFCSVIFGLSARAFALVFAGSRTSTLEPG